MVVEFAFFLILCCFECFSVWVSVILCVFDSVSWLVCDLVGV